MKVVVALDSFKGSVSAVEACRAAVRGLRAELPDAEVVAVPMADGGEGTAETVMRATGGSRVVEKVQGPLAGQTVEAAYAWLPGAADGRDAALVEMAAASGLDLLRPDELAPLRTTTFGTGELLASAFARAPGRVWLAIGGSATVDGGVGAAQALGWRILDEHGEPVGRGGAALERIHRIEPPADGPRPPAPVEVLCDVDNPLLGPRGAAAVFGPQKGATPEEVERLEAGLAHLAEVIERDLGRDVRSIAGAGAAGGLGAGAVAFLDATLVPGVDAVVEATGLEKAVADADWVVTGEGRLDEQSLSGKVVSGVASAARRQRCSLAVLAGAVALDAGEARRHDILEIEAATPAGMPLEEGLRRAPELIEAAARRLASRLAAPRRS